MFYNKKENINNRSLPTCGGGRTTSHPVGPRGDGAVSAEVVVAQLAPRQRSE